MSAPSLKDIFEQTNVQLRKYTVERHMRNLAFLRSSSPASRPSMWRRLLWRWQAARTWLGEVIAGRKFDDEC